VQSCSGSYPAGVLHSSVINPHQGKGRQRASGTAQRGSKGAPAQLCIISHIESSCRHSAAYRQLAVV